MRFVSFSVLLALLAPALASAQCAPGEAFCVQVNVGGRNYRVGPSDLLSLLAQQQQQPITDPVEPPQDPVVPPPQAGPGTVYGIFVGITDYQGQNQELPGVADGAVELAQAVVQNGLGNRDQVIALTDQDASLANLRAAFAQLAPRVGPSDTFIFFFGGHGGGGALEMIGNDALTPRTLSAMLDRVGGHSLVAIDSCESGAFASVVRRHANRDGIFSARANEISYSGGNAGDGGWVWHCLMGALNGEVHPQEDGYIHDRDLNSYVASVYHDEVTEQHAVVVANGDGLLWPAPAVG